MHRLEVAKEEAARADTAAEQMFQINFTKSEHIRCEEGEGAVEQNSE